MKKNKRERKRLQQVAAVNEDLLNDAECAAFHLMQKFHTETDCGKDGTHWAECDALAGAFGYGSWKMWAFMCGVEPRP